MGNKQSKKKVRNPKGKIKLKKLFRDFFSNIFFELSHTFQPSPYNFTTIDPFSELYNVATKEDSMNYSNVECSKEGDSTEKLKMFGVFHNYPCGIVNPAFTGMLLWDISPNHELNDYQICEFHNIKSGIILYGSEAYVFTQITNNDITSHVKILFRGATLGHNLNPSKAAKMIVKYVRYNASRLIIPSIPTIQHDLHQTMGITEVSFLHDQESYLTLLHRVYLLVFMVHYKMPLQRKHLPGRRNLSTSAYSLECRGWYSYLSHKEQKILNRPNISLCSDSIPDDLLQGKSKNEITDFSKVQFHDVQNSSMFRDGSVDNMVFQRDIQIYRHQRTKSSQKMLQTSIILTHRDKDCPPSRLSDNQSTPSLNTIQCTVKTIVQQSKKKIRLTSNLLLGIQCSMTSLNVVIYLPTILPAACHNLMRRETTVVIRSM